MTVTTKIKAGSIGCNHNEALIRDAAKAPGLKVKTGIKAGVEDPNQRSNH